MNNVSQQSPTKTVESDMKHSTAKRMTWIIFIVLLTMHVFLTWKALQFDWLFLVIGAIWPVLLLEATGLKFSSCYQFICMPNTAGWTLCLVVWGGIHYSAARLLSKWAMRE